MAGARQGDLFGLRTPGSGMAEVGSAAGSPPPSLPLLSRQLLDWQGRIAAFQGPLFEALRDHHQGAGDGEAVLPAAHQPSLFAASAHGTPDDFDPLSAARRFNPLRLTAQNLQFWRWPSPPQQGAALYVVMDRPSQLRHPLLLYVGETGRADQRWKGEHDCKDYLAAYGEALQQAGLTPLTSIRFWSDVPDAVRPRRALEQALIRLWQPPFNKETRQRWATPFTSQPD